MKVLLIKSFVSLSFLICIQNAFGQISLQARTERGLRLGSQKSGKPILSENSTISNDPTLPWRLPLSIMPLHYEILIKPILDAGYENEEELGEQWKSPGFVKIDIAVLSPTKNITLHAKDIEIFEFDLYKDGEIIDIAERANFIEEHMFYVVDLKEELDAGTNYTIEIKFTSKIQVELHGLYRSSYTDPETGNLKTLAVTQMEAINAREVFPCFDEPWFKATFQFTIGHHNKYIALSNAKSIETTPMGIEDWSLEKFEVTVKMSTYLLAMLISEFEYQQAPGDNPPTVRTYAPKHYIERDAGVYASEKGKILLEFYGEHFGQDYPMDKMDMAAVPDFYFGAMENFGLNIYKESALLYFPDESTEAERKRITTIVAHELAHQWFGNLVSPAWWTHIWLNEGISTFVEFIGMEKTIPEFKPWDIFINDALQVALNFDENKESTHTLKIDEEQWHTRGPMDWFDQLTYEKGGSLMHMIEGVLTEPVLRKGLNHYQAEMKFKNAQQDDLFTKLMEESEVASALPDGYTIASIMESWTLQSGFPLVTITRGEGNVIEASQSKFGDTDSEDLWVIPLSIATGETPDFDPKPESWLTEKSIQLGEELSGTSWVIANAGSTGYYRVKYDSNLENLILEQLASDHTVINHLSRSQLLDDYFHSSWEKQVNVEDALKFTKYLTSKPEEELVVWTAIFTNLNKALDLLGSTGMLNDMKSYILPAIKLAIEATGGVNAINLESKGYDVMRHTQFLDWACSLGDDDCLKYSSDLISDWETNPETNPVPRDLKPIVYCAAVANDGVTFIHDRYKENKWTSKQSELLLNALSCVDSTEEIDRLLVGVFSDEIFIEKSHGASFMQGLAGNVKARKSLMTFIRTNTAEIVERFDDSSVLVSTVAALSKFMSTEEELNEVQSLIDENSDVFKDSLDRYVTIIQSNINWVKEFGEPMQKFFKENSDPVTTTTSAPISSSEVPSSSSSEATSSPASSSQATSSPASSSQATSSPASSSQATSSPASSSQATSSPASSSQATSSPASSSQATSSPASSSQATSSPASSSQATSSPASSSQATSSPASSSQATSSPPTGSTDIPSSSSTENDNSSASKLNQYIFAVVLISQSFLLFLQQ